MVKICIYRIEHNYNLALSLFQNLNIGYSYFILLLYAVKFYLQVVLLSVYT